MSNLNIFKSKLQSDKELQKRMSVASIINDVVEIASSAGCAVTAQEVKDDMISAISGGIKEFDSWSGYLKKENTF